ncbi:MAG: hydroxymethylbilane synthase [Nitrospirota bacterium]|nr:hydroxymethylbilane synthase [Nitrospirota bacterium]
MTERSEFSSPSRVTIATRGSQLALWQANWVKARILSHFPDTEVVLNIIKTTGDKITDVPLAQVGGKGLFVKEIEEALLDGSADLAVHSMKDVPAQLPEGLELSAIPEREDQRDAFISNHHARLDDLPQGAKVGSSSLRRQSQLRARRPDLKVEMLRGNVDTRLRKLDEGEYDAIILAAAGVTRLGWADRVKEYLDPQICLPAVGQGALGIESRIGDEALEPVLELFRDPATTVCVTAERAFLLRLEGGCQVPIAAMAETRGDRVYLTGLVASVNGDRVVKKTGDAPHGDCERLGLELAETVLSAGGGAILTEVYGYDPTHGGGE